ncbi:hypothetical protein HMEPL2_03080 [Vreelandella aquamarina]|uniref:Uncharacterized protein n=1 Tax=Vreelandella aquamarina TaxID=77097 RepID=A0A6F8XA37_9GAMM|nr:hypothetical protein HMEPL2_03080 [Halomonas meridiana]
MRERGRTRRLFGLGARTGGALLKTRLGGQGAPLALFAPGEQDFSDVRVHRRLRELTPKVWAAMDRLQPPADTLLLSRALNGHYWNLVRLKARLDMHDRAQPLLGWARTA